MDDILYIIFFFVIVLVNVVSNIKKGKEKTSQMEGQTRKASKTIRDVISQSEDEVVIVNNPLDTLEKKIEEKKFFPKEGKKCNNNVNQKSNPFLATEEGVSSVVPPTNSMNVKNEKILNDDFFKKIELENKDEMVGSSIEINFEDVEEVKKAFVLSEILNRRY